MIRGNLLPPSSEQKGEPRPKVRIVASCPPFRMLRNIPIKTTFLLYPENRDPGLYQNLSNHPSK
jgi:hypothetical protein